MLGSQYNDPGLISQFSTPIFVWGPTGAPNTAAKYVFDARTGNCRHVATGRFVAARDLPWPSNAGFANSTRQTIQPGAMLDRHGKPSGRFFGEP